jgi:iron complex outermembrane recepter protein
MLPVAFLILSAAMAPAQEPSHAVAIGPGRLGDAIEQLGRQTGTSIGMRDPALAGLKVGKVSGRLSAGEALERLLRGTGVRARRVAPGTYLIERGPPVAARPPRPKPRPPLAPAPDMGGGKDIIVTASKRDVPLGAYPGGVQIVDGATISDAEAGRGTEAVATRVASLASTHLGPGRNKLFIRGIADSSFVGPTQATVGQYWGNSRISYSAPDPSLRLYDVGRIEVLEGPQGTLYGAGSLGGVLRVVPRAPDLLSPERRAWGGLQFVEHGDAAVDLGGLINVPIVEGSLGLRALAFSTVEGGYIDDRQRGLDDVNRVRTFGARAGLRWDVDGWTIDASGLGQRIAGDDAQYADRDGGGLSRASAFAQPFRNEYWLGELVARKRWGPTELTTATGHSRQYVSEMFEGVAIASAAAPYPIQPLASVPAAAYRQVNRIEMTNWETRLTRHGADGTGWLIALSALRNVARVNRSLGSARVTLTGVRNGVTEVTLYGEGTVRTAPGLTITAGGRLAYSRLSGNVEDADALVAFRANPAARAARIETRLLPSLAIAWKPLEGMTLFGRFQQGFRPGGLAVRRDFIERFEGDRLSTFETGARLTGSEFELTASASWTRWANIQADLIDGYGFPVTANVGDGRVVSAGLAGKWRPVSAFEFDASIYLNASKVTESFTAARLTAEGPIDFRRLPNVADASGRVGANYRTTLGNLDLQAGGYLRYVGQSTLGIGPILGRLQGDYLDSGLDLRVGRGGTMVSLSLTNLLDERGNRFALGTPFLVRDQDQVTPMRPRALRIGFETAF